MKWNQDKLKIIIDRYLKNNGNHLEIQGSIVGKNILKTLVKAKI